MPASNEQGFPIGAKEQLSGPLEAWVLEGAQLDTGLCVANSDHRLVVRMQGGQQIRVAGKRAGDHCGLPWKRERLQTAARGEVPDQHVRLVAAGREGQSVSAVGGMASSRRPGSEAQTDRV